MKTEVKTNLDVATEILKQLGGRQFIAMTGSKNFVGSSSCLAMSLIRNKSGAGYLKIHLNGLDLYEMSFYKVRANDYLPIVVKEYKNVYAEDLQAIFTSVTGLYTSL